METVEQDFAEELNHRRLNKAYLRLAEEAKKLKENPQDTLSVESQSSINANREGRKRSSRPSSYGSYSLDRSHIMRSRRTFVRLLLY